MSLILYYSPLSPPSRAVRSFLDLNNILYQGKVIDLMKGENKTAEFQNINPNQSLPVLVDGGLKLFESHAILKYIAIKKGLDQFYPKNKQNRAKVDCFLDWSQTGFEAIGKYVNQCFLFPMMMKKPVPDNKDEMYKDVIDTLKFFESVFLKDRYILNQPSITLADIKATADLSTLFITGLNFDEFPKLKELLQEIFSIKEVQNAYLEYINMVKGMKPNDSILYILNGQDKKQSWKINLYYHPWSAPSRSARTVLLFSGLEYNEKIINLLQGQNKTPEFKAINPNETIPAIQDGNLNLFESNAIMRYVSKKYQLTNLYPNDPKLKAQVDQYLDFHCTEMASIPKFCFTCYLAPMLMKAPVPTDKQQQQQDVMETLKFFYRVFLNNGQWKYINNQQMYTLADIKFCCDIAQLFITELQFENINGLSEYIERIFQIPVMKKSHQEYFQFLQNQKVGRLATQCMKTMPIRPSEKITLYFNFVSPAAKAPKSLLLLAQIPYTEKDIDLQNGENRKKPFTDINPNESIPALSYGQFNLFESHAIMKFLCIQFNLTDFYPNFPLRSKIDQYLDYHQTNTSHCVLFAVDFFFGPKFMKREMPQNKEQRLREINELIQFIIEVFLGGGKFKYIMGARGPTIADLSFICQVTTLFFVDFDFTPYPALKQYLRNIYSIQPIREAYSKFFTVARFMGPSMNPFIMSIIKGTEEGQSSCCQLI